LQDKANKEDWGSCHQIVLVNTW